MTFTIRPGMPPDAAALAELAARTFRETYAAENRAEHLAAYLAQAYGEALQRRELEDAAITTLLVESSGTPIGYAQIRRGPAPPCVEGGMPLEVWRFYVAHAWHGQGVAQQLMHAVVSTATRLGARPLWLGVWERNPRAIAFYRKCGFVDVGAHLFMVGPDAQTDRVMVRRPGPAPGA